MRFLCDDPLRKLPNIGEKLARLLREEGIESAADIRRIGPPEIYRRLQLKSQKRLPVCYYLYSLEGAVRGVHWSSLSPQIKYGLRLEAGLPE